METKFKTGDKVRLLGGNGVAGFAGGWIGSTMHQYVGTEQTLGDKYRDCGWHIDAIGSIWDERCIEPISVEAKPRPQGQAGGLKFDAGKAQWHLLLSAKGMIKALLGVVKILMFGAKKYAAHSWREVEDNERRYLDGLFRHYAAIMEGGLQARDEESGELHIDHLNCNGLFLGELARKEKTDAK